MIKFNSSPEPTIGVEIELAMSSLGYKKYYNVLEEILNNYTGSTKQRDLYNKSKSFENVLKTLKDQFYK